MATNPFAGAGLGAFGGDAGKAQALARSAYGESEKGRYDAKGVRKPTLLSGYIASLIPGSAPPLETPVIPAPQPSPVQSTAPVLPPTMNSQMNPSNIIQPIIQPIINAHPELHKRLTESRIDWGF